MKMYIIQLLKVLEKIYQLEEFLLQLVLNVLKEPLVLK